MDIQAKTITDIISNVERVIVGKNAAIGLILCAILADGHVLIEDVPGVGKTTMVYSIAKSLNMSYKRIQFTPDVLPSDITGFSMYNQKTGEFEYREGLVMSQIILADEINRTSPKTQSSLLEVMEERQITVDGNTYAAPDPFIVLATQNPIEHVGTYPLPEAQIDRFLMKISLGYPNFQDECAVLNRFRSSDPLDSLMPVTDVGMILHMRNECKNVFIHPDIERYVVSLSSHTRSHPAVQLGVSPRGSIFLIRAAQAFAYIMGRNFVLPDDVQYLVPYVYSHRIIMRYDARTRKITPESIIEEALRTVQVPMLSGDRKR